MSSNIGVNIVEREAADAGRIVPSDIFSVGCVSTSRRGPIAIAVALYNVNEDKRVFGEFGTAYLGGYMRRGLFNNCQEYGAQVYNVRVVGTGAAASTLALPDTGDDDSWVVTSGYLGYESPGADGDNTSMKIVASKSDTAKRDLFVYYKGPKDGAAVLVEQFTDLDNSNVVDIVNSKSNYIKVALAADATLVPKVTVAAQSLTGGADGTAPVQSDYTTAFAKLNGVEVPLVFNADLHVAASATALQTYVESRGTSMGIIASAYGSSLATLTTEYQAFMKSKSFMVGYRGWVNVDNENGGLIAVPAIGHAIGAGWIRKAIERGGYPWIAPAGPATALRDVVSLEVAGYAPAEVDTCVQLGFNPIMFVQGNGFVVRTSRTFSSLRKNYSAHVRRTTNFFISSFKRAFMWIEQEPNTAETRRRISDGLTFFAQDCYRNGAFNTRGGYDNNVRVKCDEENNSQNMVDLGELACDFSFHPVEAVESATINIFQTRDNLNVTEK